MKNFSKIVIGAFAAAVLGLTGLALAASTSNTGSAIYFGYNPSTGLETTHGADVSGGVLPVISVTGTSCAITSVVGGASSGAFVQTGGTSCTYTLTFPAAAPNGWVCFMNDLTTVADTPKAASTTTTTWVSAATTTVSADTTQFSCVGY